MINIFKKMRNKIAYYYLFQAARKIEMFSLENKLWRINANLTEVHAELLIQNIFLLKEKSVFSDLSKLRISSKFLNLADLEIYKNDVITQTQSFVEGKTTARPNINDGKLARLPYRDVSVFSFLEIRDENDLIVALKRIRSICHQIDGHCKNAKSSRRSILENVCRDLFSPLITILQEFFEVLYANQTTRAAR